MKRKIDLTGQLSLAFTFDAPTQQPPTITDLEKAEAVVQKYLRVHDNLSQYYTYCSERTPRCEFPGKHPMMQRYYKLWHLIKPVGTRAIEALHLECVSFKDTEDRYFEVQNKKGHQEEAQELRRLLDGFGFIQQVFDHYNHTEERYLEEGDEFDPDNCEGYEEGKPIGYWYWSFEDHIARIPVPKILLEKYITQYSEL